jgi:phosphoglycerol geranylgeranyltransferase
MAKVLHFCFMMPPPMPVYPYLLELKQYRKKALAVLIDPDKASPDHLEQIIKNSEAAGIDFYFVGGSLLLTPQLEATVLALKKGSSIPVVLFPGAAGHITPAADALLYLSLISGRNPELLIGQHVLSALAVKRSGLEVLPTGYMLIDGGTATTVSYISNTAPLPHNKPDIAICTALAGELLGMGLIYMDAGSGALQPVPAQTIEAVASQISVPLIVGGGINDPQKAYLAAKAGAEVVVVGNILEQQPSLINEMAVAVHQAGRLFDPQKT